MGKALNYDPGKKLDDIKKAGNTDVAKKKTSRKKDVLDKRTKGLPDPHLARVDMYRFDKRVRFLFEVPEVLKDDFMEFARKLNKEDKSHGFIDKNGNVIQKRVFYHCLRMAGMDIPDSDLLDARARVRK